MIEKMLKLDCTDFLLFLTDHNGFVVHEFEGIDALTWHIAAIRQDEKKKGLAIPKWEL
jgi:hypothetical protein